MFSSIYKGGDLEESEEVDNVGSSPASGVTKSGVPGNKSTENCKTNENEKYFEKKKENSQSRSKSGEKSSTSSSNNIGSSRIPKPSPIITKLEDKEPPLPEHTTSPIFGSGNGGTSRRKRTKSVHFSPETAYAVNRALSNHEKKNNCAENHGSSIPSTINRNTPPSPKTPLRLRISPPTFYLNANSTSSTSGGNNNYEIESPLMNSRYMLHSKSVPNFNLEDFIHKDVTDNDKPTSKLSFLDEEVIQLEEQDDVVFDDIEKRSSFSSGSPKEEQKHHHYQHHHSNSTPNRRIRAFSLDLKDTNQYFEHKLFLVKRQTDQDVKSFSIEIENLLRNSTDKDEIHALGELQNLSQKIIDTPVGQLKSEYKQLMNTMNESLKTYNKAPKSVQAIMWKKLLFIFSRCSRLMEYLRVQQKQSEQKNAHLRGIEKSLRLRRLKSLSLLLDSPRTSDGTPTSGTSSSPSSPIPELFDSRIEKKNKQDIELPLLKRIISKSNSVSSYESSPSEDSKVKAVDTQKSLNSACDPSASSSLFGKIVEAWKIWLKPKQNANSSPSDTATTTKSPKLTTSSSEKRLEPQAGLKKSQSNLAPISIDPKMTSPKTLELLCRICEELVSSDKLEEHSKNCAIRHNIDMKAITSDERLKRLVISIKKKIDATKKSGRKSHEKEIISLTDLRLIAKEAAELPYSTEGIEECTLLLNELQAVIEKYSPSENNKENQTTKPRKSRSITVPIFGRRIEEVIKQKLATMKERIELAAKSGITDNKAPHKTSITDFIILKPISRGAYGRVFLAKKKKTGDLYAIKVLNKREMLRKSAQMKQILAERNIMAMANNNFVTKVYYSFQGQDYLYIVMEYCPGGDLFSLLQDHTYFEIELARQYIAELVLALEYLHSKGIVHRDVKPDNMLVDQNGHLKLTDFGLSEVALVDRDPFHEEHTSPLFDPTVLTSPSSVQSPKSTGSVATPEPQQQQEALNFCGTPDYLSPEILLGQEHSYPVDWWALGIITFEFLTGCPPFNAATPQQIFENILYEDINWSEFEDYIPASAIDFINKLLVRDPKKRLGFNGAQEVKAHPFFAGVNWNTLLTQKSLFVPSTSGDLDTRYFDPRQNVYPVDDTAIDDEQDPEAISEESSSNPSVTAMKNSFEDTSLSFVGSPQGLSVDNHFSFDLQHTWNLAEKNKELLKQAKQHARSPT